MEKWLKTEQRGEREMEQNEATSALCALKLVQMILSNIPYFHLSSDLHSPDFLWDG